MITLTTTTTITTAAVNFASSSPSARSTLFLHDTAQHPPRRILLIFSLRRLALARIASIVACASVQHLSPRHPIPGICSTIPLRSTYQRRRARGGLPRRMSHHRRSDVYYNDGSPPRTIGLEQ